MPSVSYSETSSYLLCKRKHHYGYTQSLQRVTESTSLQLGSAGHRVLEAYYREILAAGDTLKAQRAAMPEALAKARSEYELILNEGFEDDPRKASLHEIVFDFYIPNEPFVSAGWIIQAVEMDFRVDVEVEEGVFIETPFVIDLIALDPQGRTVVIDHKFVYDFYTHDMARLQPQIPLYMAGLRGLGHHVDYGLYNMMRNRQIKGTKRKDGSYPGATWEQRRNALEVTPNAQRVQRTFIDQINTAVEIQKIKELTPEEQDLRATRVANNMVCKSCSFADLCKIELEGGNAKLVRRSEYKIRERRTFEASEEVEALTE